MEVSMSIPRSNHGLNVSLQGKAYSGSVDGDGPTKVE